MAPFLLACFGCGGAASKATADEAEEEQRRGGPVVVELFSSQGCGTSPEAEMFLSRLRRDSDLGEDMHVAVLSFHVDYWDYRGWMDPFASSAWTVRQKAYVESLRLDTLYTPQVVVQGRAQCLGTDKGGLLAAIRDAPRFPSPTMRATFRKPAPETLQVTLTGALRTKVDGSGAQVIVVLYENGLVTECGNGENKGKVMTNDYVVRRMEKMCTVKDVSAKKRVSGKISFGLWEGFTAAKCGVLLFVQNRASLVFGCQEFQIPDTV